MLKALCGSALLLLVFSGVSWADTYKCTRPDGSIFFTDDLSQVPKGCTIERVENLRFIQKPPEPPAGEAPMPNAGEAPTPSAQDSLVPEEQPGDTTSFDALKDEATQLGEEYRNARRKISGYAYVSDDVKMKYELSQIKARANALRDEINQSSLSSAEKQELESLLPPRSE